jgi:hypothetical protein
LPGHFDKIEVVGARAPEVVIAKFINLGGAVDSSSGIDIYGGATIQIIESLRGKLTGKVPVLYDLFIMPGNDQESLPQLNTTYIMFMQSIGTDGHRIFKLLSASDANVAKVRALIAASPATK